MNESFSSAYVQLFDYICLNKQRCFLQQIWNDKLEAGLWISRVVSNSKFLIFYLICVKNEKYNWNERCVFLLIFITFKWNTSYSLIPTNKENIN